MSKANIYPIYNQKSKKDLENNSSLTEFRPQKSPNVVDSLILNKNQLPYERVSSNYRNIAQAQNSINSNSVKRQSLQIEGKYEVFANYATQFNKSSNHNEATQLNNKINIFSQPNVFIARTNTISELRIVNNCCTVINLSGECSIEKQLLSKTNVEEQQLKEILPSKTKLYMKKMGGECRLSRYLKRRRHLVHRIAPIVEETAEEVNTITQNDERLSTNNKEHNFPNSNLEKCGCLNACCGCWKAKSEDIEIFHTRTRVVQISSPLSSSNRISNNNNCQKGSLANKCCDKHSQYPRIETISSSIALKPSYGKVVNLHNYGEIVTCKENGLFRPQMENSSLCQTGKHLNISTNKKDNENFGSKKNLSIRFHWLIRPFRGRYRKSNHSGHRHAVVQKMFFVNWNKPPVTIWHGYGVKRCQDNNVLPALLRRTRSAIF